MNSKNQFSKAFTLIELLVVIAVLGVLAAGVLTAINPLRRIQQANDARRKNDIGQIAQAMQAYNVASANNGGAVYYPSAISDLVPNDLKLEPKDPTTGASYSIVVSPANCTTAAKTCTNIAIYATLQAPDVAANVAFCWRSSTNTTTATTVALCTAP